MANTNIGAASPQANKQFSRALSAMAVRAPTPLKSLSGPMPTHSDAERKIRQQTSTDMPIVQVTELASAPGTRVQLDCAHVVRGRPIMGDRNAEGLGAEMRFSSVEIDIDMATIPVSAGGKMSNKRTPHDMRKLAVAQLKGLMPRLRWQRCLAHLAGARGSQNDNSWVLPLASDPEFAEMMVNAVRAPTFNRHFVVDGSGFVQGGQQLGSVDSTDTMKLSHIDELAALWDELSVKMQPLQLPGDMAGGDDPIKGVLMVDPLVWDSLLTDSTANYNLRQWQAAAVDRAKYGDLGKHPLFAGSPILWNGVLVRKMQNAIRFAASENVRVITSANRLTATESNQAVAAGLSTTHVVARSIFLSSQALGVASGGNQTSEETYSLLENTTNFGRNLELAGEMIGGEMKLRWSLPNASGDLEPTDFGVMVIDSVVRARNV